MMSLTAVHPPPSPLHERPQLRSQLRLLRRRRFQCHHTIHRYSTATKYYHRWTTILVVVVVVAIVSVLSAHHHATTTTVVMAATINNSGGRKSRRMVGSTTATEQVAVEWEAKEEETTSTLFEDHDVTTTTTDGTFWTSTNDDGDDYWDGDENSVNYNDSICESIIAIASTPLFESYANVEGSGGTGTQHNEEIEFVCELSNGDIVPISATSRQNMQMKTALNDGTLISAVSTIVVEKVDVIARMEGGDTVEMEFAIMEGEEGADDEGGGEWSMTMEDIMTASDGGTVEGVTLPPGSIQLYTPTADSTDETNGSLLRGRRRRRRRQRRSLANYTGTKPVLVVRVTDVDGLAPSNDANFISDKIFGTRGDSVTPVSQFALCSYGAYNIVYNDYGTRTAEIVGKLSAPGVLDVTIPVSLKNSKKHEVTNAVHSAVATKLGFSAKPGPFAHVVIIVEKCYVDCGWAGYATVNSWLSVFQGKNYMFPAVIMHEFGHNLNFGHSGVGDKSYADHGCLMGNPYYSDDVAGMCFNPAKTYQLIMSNGKNNHKGNWYDVSRVSIWDPSVTNEGSMSWTGTLVGVAEYGQISVDEGGGQRLVLRIVSGGTNDLYIGFNRKKGMNKDNKQGSDMVTIIEATAGGVFSTSIRKAVLKQGQSYFISNWRDDGSNLEIVVNTIRTDVVPGYATVRAAIVGGDGPANPPTNPPTKSGIQPTPPPTPDTSLSPSFPPVDNPTTPIPSFLPPSFPPTPNPTPVPSVSPVVPPTPNPTPEPSTSTVVQPVMKKLPTIIDSAGKRCKGVIFTVLAKQDVIISGMDVISKMNRTTDVTIYTKTGSYHNGTSPIQPELRADEWQQIYSGAIPFEPYQLVTLDDFSVGVSISAGQTQSFHVLFSLGQLFTVGNALEAPVEVVAEDDSIVIYEGQAMRDVFKGLFGRGKWNGVMRYIIK